MEDTVRSFIAIELSPQAHDELAGLQSSIKKADADIKWIEPENIHLTLKFLGDVGTKQLEKIKKILEETAAGFKAFELTMKGLGTFPERGSPRVIWVGVDLGAAEAAQIARALELRLQAYGIQEEERGFHPHITLGRVRNRRNYDNLRKAIETIRFNGTSRIRVAYLALFSSRLTPRGSIYVPLFKANMAIS